MTLLKKRMIPALLGLFSLTNIGVAADRPEYECYRLPSPPAIDGDLSDWPATIPVLFLGQEKHLGSGEWKGPQDTSAMIRVAWDQSAIYFAIEVFDDKIVQTLPANQSGNIFLQDSIQWAMDFKPKKERAGQGYDGDCYEYGFGKTQAGPVVFRWHVSAAGLVPGLTDQVRLTVVPMKDGKGLIYEAAVPFEQLIPLRPGAGEIGFNIVIQDQDQNSHKNLQWTGGVTAGKDPGKFGLLKFVNAVASNKGGLFISSQDTVAVDSVPIRVYAPAFSSGATAEFTLKSSDGKTLGSGQMARVEIAGKTAFDSTIDASRLTAGDYVWNVTVTDSSTGTKQTSRWLFQRIDYSPLQTQLAELRKNLDEQIKAAQSQNIAADYAIGVQKVSELFARYTQEDIKNGQHALVKRNLSALCLKVDQTIRDLKTQISSESQRQFWSVPKPDMSRLTIRNGNFAVDDEPVMLVGTMAWLWQIQAGAKHHAEFGFNATRVDMAQRDFYTNGVIKKDIPWWALKHCVDVAHKDNLAIGDFLGVWDAWAIASKAKIDKLADIRALYTQWLDQTFTWQKPGSFFNHTISVEGWRPALTGMPLVERTQEYQNWLAKEYGGIEKYNSICGTNLKSFSEAAIPSRDDSHPAKRYDRSRFAQERTAEELLWARSEVKKRDPNSFVSGYGTLLDWDDESDFSRSGYDPELDLKAYDIADYDTCGDFHDARYALSTIHWSAMYRDMVGSLAPEKPQFDNEFHFANLRKPYPAGFVSAIYWQAYIHGVSGTSAWVWHRSSDIDSALLLEANVALELSHTALDIRRLSREISMFHQQKPDVYMLRSIASSPHGAHLTQMKVIYEGLFFEGRKIGFLTEDQVAREIPSNTRLLIVPAVTHTSPEAAEAVAKFARNGGNVVLIGPCFTHDRRHVRSSTSITGDHVKKLSLFGSISTVRSKLVPLLPQTQNLKVVAPVNSKGVPSIEWRTAWDEKNQQWLLYILNIGYEPVAVNLQLDGKSVGGTDTLTGQPVQSGSTLKSLELRVVRISPS